MNKNDIIIIIMITIMLGITSEVITKMV